MEAELFAFKNCSNLTNEQITTIAFARGITAVVCYVLLLIVLVTLVILAYLYPQKVHGTVVKRLAIGLTAAAVLFQLILALHLKYYFDPQDTTFCKVDAFFNQYLASVQLLFILGIIVGLFFKVLYLTTSLKLMNEKAKECTFTFFRWKINKLELVLLTSVFVLPLLFDWIPFATNSYGPYGPWCWIRIIETDCSTHVAGMWAKIGLMDVPTGLVALLALVLFAASLCLLWYGTKNAGVEKLVLIEVGITETIFFLTFLAVVLSQWSLEATAKSSYTFWIIFALLPPLAFTLIPLALLIAIQLPFSAMIACACHKHQRRIIYQNYPVTLHNSSDWSGINQPSHTTWDSPHSSNEDSETLPFARATGLWKVST